MTNVPSPYRVNFFNELGKECDLTVTFEKKNSDERGDTWGNYKFENFKGVFLKGVSISTDTAICFDIKKVIKKGKFDRIICANFTSPTGMIAIEYMRKKRIPYYLESDGGIAKDGKGFKEKIKKHFIFGAEGYFSTSMLHDGYYTAYGAPKMKLIRYPFTSLYEKDISDNIPTKEEKISLRGKLGITEEKVVISVGRFSYLNGYGKGYDVLLRAAKKLDENIGWYIVGGQPTEEFVQLTKESGLKNIHYIDFKGKEELKEYYKASDLFVLMTVSDVWGLVVNEAMSNGLPVITTDKCVAGVELVKEGENGFILPVGDDEGLAKKVETFFADESKAEEMAKNALETIRPYTIENMANTHVQVFEKLAKKGL